MKKLCIVAVMVLISSITFAQTNQVVWMNGRAVLGQSIYQVDSLKFGEMGGDTLHLILPYAAIIRDTVIVRDTTIVRDTVYIDKCDTSRVPKTVEMVDLGLSVKWANMNVGATKPEEYGDYFAWGETSAKENYNWSTYKYCNGSSTSLTKYCSSSDCGTVDNKTTLEPEDDAAHVNWGENWRMPTHEEIEELYSNCYFRWTNSYQGSGVAGRICISKKSGYTDKSIFLPYTGCRSDEKFYYSSYGFFLSSSLFNQHSGGAWSLKYNSDALSAYNSVSRDCGYTVRAVCPK